MVERHIYGYRWKKTGAYVYIGSAFDVAEPRATLKGDAGSQNNHPR